MKSQNVAIMVLFVLILILVYQLYFRKRKESFFWFGKKDSGGNFYRTFDKLEQVTPYRIYYPTSLEEIQSAITNNLGQIIRASGDNYTFNSISFTDDVIVRTDKLKNIISLDKEQKEITVESGCSIKDVCVYLQREGLGLEMVPENIQQTIGSACSTAAHGSSLDTGSMSDQIVDLVIVLANGHVRRVEFDDPEFPAYATSLGSLGIIYTITLRCVDLYVVVSERKVGDWASIKKNLINWLEQHKLSKIYIQPTTLQTVLVLRKKVTNASAGDGSDAIVSKAESYFKGSPLLEGGYTASDIAVPFERVVEAVDDILKLCQSHKKTGGYECDRSITVCFSGPDYNSWLSPASGRGTAWIQVSAGVPLKNVDKTSKFMQDYEDLLLYKYAGRPSWTTSKFINAYKARLLYGISIDYHRKVRERFDPEHMFSNDFISNIFD